MTAPVENSLRDQFPDIFFFIDRDECALRYSPRFREFSLAARPNYGATQIIRFCPFSGAPLPEPLRDRFFDELEAIGLTDGLSDIERAPNEFQSEAWWISRGL